MKWLATAVLTGLLAISAWSASAPDELSPVEVLLIKEQIRDAIASSDLYRYGDGVQPQDVKRAQQLFTADGVFEGYAPDGQLIFRWRVNGETGEVSVTEGLSREEIGKTGKSTAVADGRAVAAYHYPVSIKFDRITPTVVETRTTALALTATKNTAGPQCTLCASKPVSAVIVVYHDVWHLTPRGWRKHFSREYLLT